MVLANVAGANISDRVADELREAIQSGALEPMERLVERKLAERMGVSHIPVREALAKLAEEGLVERTPRRGARVAALTDDELAEISSLRIVLEQFVGVRAQERWTSQAEKKLNSIAASMVSAATKGDVEQMFALDRKFHETLWELADHKVLLGVASQLRSRINGFLRAANGTLEGEGLIAHAASHSELIDALASGDPEQARAAMAQHIEIAAARIVTVEGGSRATV